VPPPAETSLRAIPNTKAEIGEQEYFDNGILMVAMVKAGVELAFEVMVSRRHHRRVSLLRVTARAPLIANTDRAQASVRDERGDFRYRRVRLLPVRQRLPCRCCARLHAQGRHRRHWQEASRRDNSVDNGA
jgi:hypothetical protein